MTEILEFAKKLEREGKKHYSQLEKKTSEKGLKGIFHALAQEEQNHFNLFAAWKKEIPHPPPAESRILGKAKEVFAALAKDFSISDNLINHEKAYAKALELEQKSIAFYTEAKTKTDVPEHQTLFTFLIGEEKKHAFLMENLIEFVRRPRQWVEDAEFNHLDEF